MLRAAWFLLGCVALLLGVIGIALPLLPTVPFLLLAAIGFGNSSERVHDWLLGHPKLGPPIHDWRANGVIRRRVKWLASLSILAAFLLAAIFGAGVKILLIQIVVLAGVSIFIWTRPEKPRN
ncbi:YbaN family protein [Oceanomicrobium pacificus]|uniref:DUF454 family protein n=1 Tax=Oceanomicrobium pacificus TaxID=2692916 RepID=A0A6B0TSK7_9RHOB|nr:YbaN family protein [Oceanomicrobium pacificus]MXU64708.1 DUF454 family protein [Oceanomicrobium pacificus]